MNPLSYYSEKFSMLKAQKTIHEDRKAYLINEIAGYDKRLDILEKAQVFIQTVAQETQSQLKFQITEIVQLALDACWPGEYVFSLDFEIKRNRTEAILCFMNDDFPVDPTEEDGGGAVDVASFALRLATWSLGKTAPVILVDEPFKMLSVDLSEKIAGIIKELSEKLGVQFIMVTSHGLDMTDISDKTFEVTKTKNISEVTIK